MTELRILTQMDSCPFICNSHCAFQDSCYVYLVLDLARGESLKMNYISELNMTQQEGTLDIIWASLVTALVKLEPNSTYAKLLWPLSTAIECAFCIVSL